MDDLEARQRAALVKEATSWIGTPYHNEGRVKGAGVDCAMHLAESAYACGLIPRIATPHYSPDWAHNRGEERYLEMVEKFCTQIPGPGLPGDLVLYKFGRCWSHGGIIIKWPIIVHAFINRKVQTQDALRDHQLMYMGEAGNRPRPRRFYTLWPNGGLDPIQPPSGPPVPQGGV